MVTDIYFGILQKSGFDTWTSTEQPSLQSSITINFIELCNFIAPYVGILCFLAPLPTIYQISRSDVQLQRVCSSSTAMPIDCQRNHWATHKKSANNVLLSYAMRRCSPRTHPLRRTVPSASYQCSNVDKPCLSSTRNYVSSVPSGDFAVANES